MSNGFNFRRMVVFVCLAVLLLAALAPGAAALSLAFLVLTVCLFVGITLVVLLPRADEDRYAERPLVLAAFSPRPPPAT
jgi:uncharacterized membrane protein